MSDKQDDLKNLLGNLHKSLKLYPIKEINKMLIKGINSKHEKKEEIDFVLKCVSEKYSISVRTLTTATSRGRIKDAKEVCFCLLHLDLNLSQRHIANRIFSRSWQNSIYNGVKRYKGANPKIKVDAEFLKAYEHLKSQLLKFIEEKTK